MSVHDFGSTGLESMILHLRHDSLSDSLSSHSLPPATALDGYIMVPKSDRIPLAPKSRNVQNPPILKSGTKLVNASAIAPEMPWSGLPQPCAPPTEGPSTPNAPWTPRPSTPFQPLPPVLGTSPLRFPSFVELALQSLDVELPLSPKPESPSPHPIPRHQLAIDIPSVSHVNSPYVAWPSPVRRKFLRPLTPSSQVSRYSRPYSRSGARAPEPQEADALPPPNRLLRLSRSFKNLKKTVKQGVKHVKNVLKKTSKPRVPELPALPLTPPPMTPPPPLPSPTGSCDSTRTNTLAEWLRECAAKVERGTPNLMTLEEYEERGSWWDLRSALEEPRIHSPAFSDAGDETSQRVRSPSPPVSPTCTNSDVFPRLSMLDIWPTPPRNLPPANGGRMHMPGGWNSGLRDSPASVCI